MIGTRFQHRFFQNSSGVSGSSTNHGIEHQHVLRIHVIIVVPNIHVIIVLVQIIIVIIAEITNQSHFMQFFKRFSFTYLLLELEFVLDKRFAAIEIEAITKFMKVKVDKPVSQSSLKSL